MNIFSQKDAESLAKECLDKDKVLLQCSIHKWVYNMKGKDGKPVPPNFRCKQCMMVSFMGLMANTPPEKRSETMEMLEYSINHLIEAEKRGEINKETLFERPEVSIERGVN